MVDFAGNIDTSSLTTAFNDTFKSGTATLVDSLVIINDVKVLTTSKIICGYQNINSIIEKDNVGAVYVDNINANTSFTIKSTHNADNNSIYYIIFY